MTGVRQYRDWQPLEELKPKPGVLPGGRRRRVLAGLTMRGDGEPEMPGTPGRRRRVGGAPGGRRRRSGGGAVSTIRVGGEPERPGRTGKRRIRGGGDSGGRRRIISSAP